METDALLLPMDELYSAFNAANDIVLKKHLTQLSDCTCADLGEISNITIGSNVYLSRIENIVYDQNENIRDKLTTVYATALSMRSSSIVMILDADKEGVQLYFGIAGKRFEIETKNGSTVWKAKEKALENDERTLRQTFSGNFPGTVFKAVNNNRVEIEDKTIPGKKEILQSILKNCKCIAGVSSIPALRNSNEFKNTEFVQGLEKLIDSLSGKKYTMLVLADVMNNDNIEALCAQYEDIYSQISPFKQSVQTVGTSEGATDTESFLQGVTDTTNQAVTNTLTSGTSEMKTHTDTAGVSTSASISSGIRLFYEGKVNIGANYSHSFSRTKGTIRSESESQTNGVAKSLTTQNSVAKALTNTQSESVQITNENRAVRTLMERIDEQIKRLRSCEDFGLFDTCAYFLTDRPETALAAASAFKSLTRGENSSIEASAVNLWYEKAQVDRIKEYLARFYHPEFVGYSAKNSENGEETELRVTPSSLVSGNEIPFLLPLPKKSVAGIPVFTCAEFGREIFSEEKKFPDVLLGKIYHMHHVTEQALYLDKQSLAAHTFITGATGSGKSNTVYTILNRITSRKKDESNISFMVIEPAKGEYKQVFGNRNDVFVYGTNPKLTPMLRINPFAFPDSIHVLEHVDRLVEIFNACWPMYAAMPAVLKDAVISAYEKCGWSLIDSVNAFTPKRYPCFEDVSECVKTAINSSSYSADTKGDYTGSLITRLHSLTNGINGLIFSADELADQSMFDKNVIVDLSRVGSMETKALIMGVLILRLNEYRMSTAKGSNSALKHITVLEEAHNLLKRTSTAQGQEAANLSGKSVEMISNAIAEMRTYGEGFIIADQSPTSVDISAIKNTNTKILMRLPEENDRQLAGKSAALRNDQLDELSRLSKGVAVVYQNDWIEPVLCKVDRFEQEAEEYVYRPENDTSGFDARRFRTELIRFLIAPKFRMSFNVSYLKQSIPQSQLTPTEKKYYSNLINEYEICKSISLWNKNNDHILTQKISHLLVENMSLTDFIDANDSLQTLDAALNNRLRLQIEIEQFSRSIQLSLLYCVMKTYALETNSRELAASWRKYAVKQGEENGTVF